MRTLISPVLILLVVLACPPARSLGQPAVDGDEVLHRARARLIGADPQDFSTVLLRLHGERDSAAEHQGFTPMDPLLSPFDGAILVDFDSGAAVRDGRSTRSDGSVRWRRAVFDGAGGVVDIDMTEQWSGARIGEPIEQERLSTARRNPLALLNEIDDLTPVGSREIDGESILEFETILRGGASLTLLIDPKTYDLRRVEQATDIPTLGDTVVAWRFDEFRAVAGAGVWPHRSTLLVGDRAFLDLQMEIQVDSADTDNLFSVPEGVPQPGPPREVRDSRPAQRSPQAQEVAPGVWVIPNIRPGFNVMFVEFDDYVVAIDAPAGYPLVDEIPVGDVASGETSASVSERFIEIIHETVPHKPIRFVVISHFHSDHAGGVRAFIAEGATVVTTREMAPFFEYIADAPHTIASDRLTREPRDLALQFVDDSYALLDASRQFVVYEVDGNPHADGLLITWLPQERVLFAPDMFYPAPLDRFPPQNRIPIMRFFVDWMDKAGIEPEEIYSSHGYPVGGLEHVARIRNWIEEAPQRR